MFEFSKKAFNEQGSLSSDVIDNTQRNLSNMKFSNYNLENHMSDYKSNNHIMFALKNPTGEM